MTLLWMAAAAGIAAALVAWRKTRATERRLEQLSQMHWELKYQVGEMRVRLHRLDPAARPDAPAAGGDARASDTFIPLSSVKR